MDENERLSKNQLKAISALLSHSTVQTAADSIGVGESTVRRWLKQPAFQAAYREAARDLVSHAVAVLQGACVEAVRALLDVMQDRTSPASARVNAAKATLELALRAIELQDIAERLTALEQAATNRR